MIRYLASRFFYSLVVLLLVSVIVFLALRLAPGDVTVQIMDPGLTAPETIAALKESLGLNDPAVVQYARYMGGVLTGDFGVSLITRQEVSTILLQCGRFTLLLAGVSFVIFIIGGISLGAIAAFRRGTLVDRAILGLAGLLLAVPNYVVAVLLIILFGLLLGWLPVSGSTEWRHLVMPALVLASMPLGLAIRMVRTSFLEHMHADYVTTLRARGISERTIRWRHQLRNALTPVVSMAAVQVRSLLGYTLIVELIFRWPGIGSKLVQSILQRDYQVAQSLTLVLAAAVVVATLAADVLYRWVDPRVRAQ